MSDIDLIPTSYRYWLWQLTWLKRFSALTAIALTLSGVSLSYWHWQQISLNQEIAILQNTDSQNQMTQRQIELEQTRKAELQSQLQLLHSARGGPPIPELLEAIDRALYGNAVWFFSWELSRERAAISDTAATTTNIGAASFKSTPEAMTKVTISGRASDLANLSTFVAELVAQPQIIEATVLDTSFLRIKNKQLVDFELLVEAKNPKATSAEATSG